MRMFIMIWFWKMIKTHKREEKKWGTIQTNLEEVAKKNSYTKQWLLGTNEWSNRLKCTTLIQIKSMRKSFFFFIRFFFSSVPLIWMVEFFLGWAHFFGYIKRATWAQHLFRFHWYLVRIKNTLGNAKAHIFVYVFAFFNWSKNENENE